jgi:hypothetical protein
MNFIMDAPVKLTIHDPENGKDRVGILFITGRNEGWGILCDDGSYIFVEEESVKMKDVFCVEMRQSFLTRGFVCVSRRVHRPIYEECKLVNKTNK